MTTAFSSFFCLMIVASGDSSPSPLLTRESPPRLFGLRDDTAPAPASPAPIATHPPCSCAPIATPAATRQEVQPPSSGAVNADTASRKYASTRVVHPSRGVGVRTFKLGLAGPASPPDLPTTRADVRTLLRFAVAGESPNTEEDTAEKLIVCCFGRRHRCRHCRLFWTVQCVVAGHLALWQSL